MPLNKPQASPGFISQATQVQAGGAWFSGNLVRWRFGLLEKIGGWKRLIDDIFAAPIRKLHAWADLDNDKNLLVATDLGLQLLVNETPYGLGSQLNLPGGYIPSGSSTSATKFSTTAGSNTVTVKTGFVATAGGSVLVQLPLSLGGRIIPAGSAFVVKSVILGVGFTFDMPALAVTTETDTYGVRLYTNDIVNGMTVTWKAHGYNVDDLIEVPQITTLITTGVNFSAEAHRLFRVASVPTADTFTISMGASGTGDGLGGPTHQVYEGSQIGVATGSTVGTAIGLSVLTPLGDPRVNSWFLANLGKNGLALASGGQLQVYHPPISNGPWITPVGVGPPATAPQRSNGMLVAMPQAQVILFGSELEGDTPGVFGTGVIDPLLLRWSEVGTYDEYLANVKNEAGQYRLSRGSKIIGAVQGPQMTLVWTDVDLWSMSYIGPPLIYGFNIIASGCGLDSPHDIGVVGSTIIWKSKNNFWTFGAGGAQVMPCSVWDYAFNDIDEENINKSFAAPSSSTTEVGFYFPSKTAAGGFEDQSGNLLLLSGDIANAMRWTLNGAVLFTPLLSKQVYVYEEGYEPSGWWDASGLNAISWLDTDLQAHLEQVVFAPDGSANVFSLQSTATNGLHQVAQTITKDRASKTYTLSIYAHNSSTRRLTLRASTSAGSAYATFDVVAGVLVTSGVSSPTFKKIKALVLTDALGTGTNGWKRYTLTFTSDDKPTLELAFNNTTNTNAISYLGDITKGTLIWGPQLAEGDDPLDYQVTGALLPQNECSLYVKYNILDTAWDSGALARTAWLGNSVFGPPLGADANMRIQQHEVGYDDDDQPMRGVFAETGYTELGDGTVMLSITQCQPDFKWFGRDGAMRVYLRGVNYPQGPDHLYGPWSMTPLTQFFAPRVRARYVAVRYEWEPLKGFSSRVGVPTFKTNPAGRRP